MSSSRGLFSVPLRVKLRMTVYEQNEDTGAKSLKYSKEQDVCIGDIPLMTDNATFIINGVERVIISQIHRSPGVFFDSVKGTGASKTNFTARIIPYNGSWLEFEFDSKDILNVRIDRRNKLPVTSLLYTLSLTDKDYAHNLSGLTKKEILDYFYNSAEYKLLKKSCKTKLREELLLGKQLTHDLVDSKTGDVLLKAGRRKVTKRNLKKWHDAGIKELSYDYSFLIGKYVSNDVVDPKQEK